MAPCTDEAMKVAGRLLGLLRAAGIRIERAILFGSYASGRPGEWSDIDLAVVSPDFSGTPFHDRRMVSPYILKVDTRIELHPFTPEDFSGGNGFVDEIVRGGVDVPLA